MATTMLAATAAPQGDLAGIVILFGAALVVAWLLRALRGPSILGYLVAGMVIGPSGLVFFDRDVEEIRFYAELGLVLLLFTVGLELSPAPLIRMGRSLIMAASLQIGVTTVLAGAAAGWLLQTSVGGALLIGLGVSLSSTAIVLKHLADRGETNTSSGGLITGILLIQDLVVILVLIALPFLAAAGGNIPLMVFKLVAALAGLVIVVGIAHFLMPKIVDLVFSLGGQELMTLFAIVMAASGAWLAGIFEWSWALGSFIAGLLLAQSDVRHQLQAEITPFRDAFNALFFMSIGMLVNLELAFAAPLTLLAIVIGILVVKLVITSGSIAIAGWTPRLAIVGGLGLCTVSEFAYVLGAGALTHDMLSPEILEQLISWIVGTMLLGAVLIPLSGPLAIALANRLPNAAKKSEAAAEITAAAGEAGHVVIVGYGTNGRNLSRVLKAVRIPELIIEQHRPTARVAQRAGLPVLVGDAARRTILEEARLSAARALVIAIADPLAVRRIVAQARDLCSEIYILARTRDEAELEALFRLGADQVIPEEFETSIEIFAHVLRKFAIPDNIIEQQVNLVRSGRYEMLRRPGYTQTVRPDWLRVLETSVTQTYYVQPDSPASGQTIRQLDLRARSGATIVAITRAGQPVTNPAPDFEIQPADVLVLVGTHHQLNRARQLLEDHAPAD